MPARPRTRLFGSIAMTLFVLLTASLVKAETTETETSFQKEASGLGARTPSDLVHIEVCNDSALHIWAAPSGADTPIATAKPWIVGRCKSDRFSVMIDASGATLATPHIKVSVSAKTGLLFFTDVSGQPLLAETAGRSYEPDRNERGIYKVTDRFFPEESEGIYGLGQHQSGTFNYRGSSVYLSQMNTDVAIPFFLSTRGYGILWNTASTTLFDNRYPNQLNLVSSAASGVDYYFFYGPEADQVIHQYRQFTGQAPMFAKWAYGFFQSKDRYESQEKLLKVIENYRADHIPVDTVVQDWFWWTKQGDSTFTSEYPDMRSAIGTLHTADHAHIIISIWPRLDQDTEIARKMRQNNLMIQNSDNYDATNPEARDLYWNQLAGPLFSLGMDGFWLDDSEPEEAGGNEAIQPGSKLFLGSSALYANIFPYDHTLGIYEHWRKDTDRKRIFLLTRSAFAGSQRNAATTWSGDVYSTFWGLQRQIPAGLNFALSGVPYWTTDIGGYGYPSFKSTNDPQFQELYTRWFEFGVFCPVFRTHGHRANNTNELTAYGSATATLVRYDKFRYRMLPYIYSLAWKVTHDDYTIMRPLVMDWRDDEQVRSLGDEFMFGPDLLVAPVTEAGGNSRSLYLPRAERWYDFWTGVPVNEGRRVVDAPIDRIPLYVKAGSILPLGSEIEYADQKPDDPLELRIYAGADGDFTVYEDAGDSYDYEKGAFATIPLHWNNRTSTLTIGRRQGTYPEMRAARRFSVVLVRPEHGVGTEITGRVDKPVEYTGQAMDVVLKAGS